MAPPSVKKYGGKKCSQSRPDLLLNPIFAQNFLEQTTQAPKKRGRPKKLHKSIGVLPTPDANHALLDESECTLHVNRLDDTFDRLKHNNEAYNKLQMPKPSSQEETQRTEDCSSSTCFLTSYENDKFDQLRERSMIISKNSYGTKLQEDISLDKSNAADLSQDNCTSMNKSIENKNTRNYPNKSMVSSTPITKTYRNNVIQSSSLSSVILLNDSTNVSLEQHLSRCVDTTEGSKSLNEVSTFLNNSRMNERKSSLRPRSKSVCYIDHVSDLMPKSHVRKQRDKVMASQDCLPIDATILSDNQSLSKHAIHDVSEENNSTPKYIKNVNVIRKKSNVSVLTELDCTNNSNLTINESATTGTGKTCHENVAQASHSTSEDWKNVNVVRKKSNITVTELDSIDNSIPIINESADTEKPKTCAQIVHRRRSARKKSCVFEGTLKDYINSPDLFGYSSDECDISDCKCKTKFYDIENKAPSATINKRKRRISKKSMKQDLVDSHNDVPTRTACLENIVAHNVDRTSKLWESSVSVINESTKRHPHWETNLIRDVEANSSHVRKRRRRRAGASANETKKLGIGHDVINLAGFEVELTPSRERNNTSDAFASGMSADWVLSSAQEVYDAESDVELNLYLSEDECMSVIASPKYADSVVSNCKVEVNEQVDESDDIVIEAADNSTVFKNMEEVHAESEVNSVEVKHRRITRTLTHSVKLINYNEDSNDSVFGPTAFGDLLNYQNGTISEYQKEVKTKAKVKSKDVKPRKRSKSLSQSVKTKNSTSAKYKTEVKTEYNVTSEEIKPRKRSKSVSQSVKLEMCEDSNDIVFDSNANSTTASINLLNCKDGTGSEVVQEVKTAGKMNSKDVKSSRSKISRSLKLKEYTEDSINTDSNSSDNPMFTPTYLLRQDATVSEDKKVVNAKREVQSKVGRKRRSHSFSHLVESKNYKEDSKDIVQDPGNSCATILENSSGSQDNGVLAITKANIPKGRGRARSVHTAIKNNKKDSGSHHAQVAEPQNNFTTCDDNEGTSELHPVSTSREEPRHNEVADNPKGTPKGRCAPNTTVLIAQNCVEFRKKLNAVTPKRDENGGASERKIKRVLSSSSPESIIIDLDEDELPGLNSPPRCTKRFTFAKPFTLAPGKSWRRSLAAIKRNTVAAAVFEGQRCTCPDCAIVNLNDSSVGRKTIFTLCSAPARPRCTSGDTEYEQNRLRDAVALESFIENISLNVSQLSVRDNQRNYPSARQLVLQRCKQGGPFKFSKWYPEALLRNCHKIGEGVYGEVFLYRNPADDTTTVMKVIPIEGEMLVNGERQKQFEEILSEIVIASELSNLRNAVRNHTTGFNQLKNVRCVKGEYPQRLVELWELYEESKGTDNDNPNMFGADQLYIVLELANAGNDLESFVFTNFSEVYNVFLQIALTLAVGEEELQFEHRDLHWGNVLISRVPKDKVCTYKLNGETIVVPTNSVEASIIDFTLSRITCDKISFYNDLSQDPDLFNAEGDYQFEIYKLMQIANGNNWEPFQPKTNILWLHYILVKMTTAVHMIKKSVTAKHKKCFHLLVDWENSILKYKSAKEFVEEAIKPLCRSK